MKTLLLSLLLLTGLATSAQAQAAFRTPNTVTFNSALMGGAATTTTYFNRANTSNTPLYQNAPLGGSSSASFDKNAGLLTLSNLSVPISVDPGDPSNGTPATVLNSVTLYYRVYPSGTNPATVTPTAVALTNTSSSATTQTYTYPRAPIDMLRQPTVTGNGSYTVQLLVTAVYDDSGNGTNPQPLSDPGSGLGRTATFNVSGFPLPVSLVAFTALRSPSAVRLSWQTASELNSARFEVERSAEGEQFRNIGDVAAAGNSANARTYAFTDTQPLPGLAYYRLRQVDQDGTAIYSPVRSVTESSLGFVLYPNPAPGGAILTGTAPGQLVQAYDALGRLTLTTQADAAGTAELVLPAGLYLVRSGAGPALRLVVE